MTARLLTPEAQLERAKRLIGEAVFDMIKAAIATGAAQSEWIDQNASPLGKRRHLELARAGRLPSKKHGRLVLIRRDDLNAFVDREGLSRGERVAEEDVVDVVEAIMRGRR